MTKQKTSAPCASCFGTLWDGSGLCLDCSSDLHALNEHNPMGSWERRVRDFRLVESTRLIRAQIDAMRLSAAPVAALT